MTNPWRDIPESDYVGHMNCPAVGQREVLGRLLGETLEAVRPDALLVLGCSTGNGLEHVDPAATSRVVVVDVNSAYLQSLRSRFQNPVFELDVRVGDVIDVDLERETYDLIHAGLIFEYVAWPALLPRVARALRAGGVLSVVLQRPSASTPAVIPTSFISLKALEPLFRFVEPRALVDLAQREGLVLSASTIQELPAGKSFRVLRFTKSMPSHA
jgi:SAM-dependent methyltransferase